MRLIVAEDSAILRDGLVALPARRGHDVVEAVGDAAALEAHVAHLARTDDLADVVVTDVRMPPTFTDEGCAPPSLCVPHTRTSASSSSPAPWRCYASDLLASGAQGVGYLLKDRVADVAEFMAALEQVAQGRPVLDPEVVSRLMGCVAPRPEPGRR